MVKPRIHNLRGTHEQGALMIELLVAMALLTSILMPIAYSVASEKRLARATYQRAVAMEIVDGEMEALVAGEWRVAAAGTHEYPVRAGRQPTFRPAGFCC